MNSLDEEAKLVGINDKVWRDYMEYIKKQEKFEQPYLNNFLKAEAEARESEIDYDTWFEHKKRLAMRWFGYYRKAKSIDSACKIGKQYNKIACMLEKDRDGRC